MRSSFVLTNFRHHLASITSILLVVGLVLILASCIVVPVIQKDSVPTIPLADIPSPIEANQNEKFSTPDLVGQAFTKGEITIDQQLLYLTYAVYEPKSLPIQFHSNVGWRGTFIVLEIKYAVTHPEIMCALNPKIQSELRRLLGGGVTCDNRHD